VNQKVADGIRAAILEICKGNAKSMNDILGDERLATFISRYGVEDVRKLVYALVGSGALFTGGRTHAAMYVTTENGKKFKKVYEKSFEEVQEEWDSLNESDNEEN
jgi:hypothetical protein